ncbi:class I SAM-dependent methyltransferase [Natranaeroarchaeum sulfidigenes]|uniref:SAM-dependent methyltransferase n=1 Tax=Natranaeroarchaeum sulfidigenes TaxID=2784880 RepID=A0A897MV17_9EURY|nr:class I SAM-dependent methyltransferase [Natranaeroarchaeum sulfidigenes]QSG04111.1 SAM-dependent methyltransferase [Natranaeroarchaeum sulfidigenes]
MDDRRAVRDAYNEMAEDYFEQYTSEVRQGSLPEPVERFCACLDADDRLLSAGCGAGDAPLGAADEQGVGLDFSREQLVLARRTTEAALVQGDMTALPFADSSFDAVAALYSLIHVPLDEHRTVVDEFARVLRPGGRLLVTEGGVEWSGSNPDWLDSGTEMRWSMAGPEATREDLRALGFEVQGVWDVRDPTTEEGTKPFFLAELSGDP